MELDILVVKGILLALASMIGIGIASKIYFFRKELEEIPVLWDVVLILDIVCTIATVIYIITRARILFLKELARLLISKLRYTAFVT
jgi:hypothetical protein